MSSPSRTTPKFPLHHNPIAVREARIKAGISLIKLAAAIGITKGHMSEIESGTRNATPDVLLRISRVLFVAVKTLKRA